LLLLLIVPTVFTTDSNPFDINYFAILGNPSYIVVFTRVPEWLDDLTPTPINKAAKFLKMPSYQDIVDKCRHFFELEQEELFLNYVIYGVSDGAEYLLLEDDFVFGQGVRVQLVPRFYTYEFHIVTFSISYSRKEIIKLCKTRCIAGSVTRDDTNSLLLRIHHFDNEKLLVFMDYLRGWFSEYKGHIDDDHIVHSIEYGSLKNKVVAHRGTASRDDNIESWRDEDAKSASTYFNAPEKSKPTPTTGSLASRMQASSK
jgi:hypothetical protein